MGDELRRQPQDVNGGLRVRAGVNCIGNSHADTSVANAVFGGDDDVVGGGGGDHQGVEGRARTNVPQRDVDAGSGQVCGRFGGGAIEFADGQNADVFVIICEQLKCGQAAADFAFANLASPALGVANGDGAAVGELQRIAQVEQRFADTAKPIFDLVVNNAGFGSSGLVHELDSDRLSDEIRLNVLALTRISHAAVRAMLPRGLGYLLNVSSVASFQPSPGLAVYAATKAYVTSFTEALHEELRSTGIRVTALCPGLTKTEFQSISNTSGFESKFPEYMWTSVESVAKAGLDGVAKGTPIVVPGALYKALSAVTAVMPRGATRWLSSVVSQLR